MTTTRTHRRRRTRLLGIGALVAVLGAGVWGFHGRLAGHGADGRHAERMRRHMEHALEHALDRIDASDAQRERIRAIADETREALLLLAGDGPGAAREAIAASLLGPEVDARRHAAGARVEVTLVARGDGAVLRVADRGPGVPAPERERIFEPFYRPAAHHEGRDGGVGLGLALVREIARAHGGDARCSPREGGGTVFEVELGASPAQVA